MDDKISNCINDSAIVEAENFEMNYFDDSSDYYTKFSATEKTNAIITPKIRKESDNYYDVSTLQGIINIYCTFHKENWHDNDLFPLYSSHTGLRVATVVCD